MMFDKALSAPESGSQRLRAMRVWLTTGLVLCLALFVHVAQAQEDPPGRVARLSEVNGQVWLLSADSDEWVSAARNQPVTTGDRVATEAGARAELQVGSTTLRVDASSELEVSRLDDNHLSLMLHSGSAAARLRDAADAGEFDLTTDTGRFRALRAGRYRFDRTANGSDLTVYEGQAVYEGQNSALTVNPGQHAEFWVDANNVAQYAMSGPYNDPFAAWINERDRVIVTQPPAYQYVSPEMTGADDLDRYGSWEQTPEYGVLWTPRTVAVDWAPYRAGHWAWVRPWGWTWVDDAPWGFAPFHYGRWVHYRDRWCWAPGQRVVRPVYAPALVAWVGGPNVSVSVRVGGGPGPAVGWFPLAPREVYVPSYRASPRYVQNVNITHVTNVTVINNVYRNPNVQRDFANRRLPNALTVVPTSVMTGRQPVAPEASRWRDSPMAREIANRPPPTVVAPPVAAPAFAARPPVDRAAVRPPPGLPQLGQSGGRPGVGGAPGRDRADRSDDRGGNRPGIAAPAAVAPPPAVAPARQPDRQADRPDRRADTPEVGRPGFQAPNADRDRNNDGRRGGNDRPGRPPIPSPNVAQPAAPAPAPAAAPVAPPPIAQRPAQVAPPQPQIPTGTIPGQVGGQRPERVERGDRGDRGDRGGDRGERFARPDRGNPQPQPEAAPQVPRNAVIRPAPQIEHPAPRAPEAVRAAPAPAPVAPPVQQAAPVQHPRAVEAPKPPAAPEARRPEAPPRARAEGARDDPRGEGRGRKDQQ